MPVANTCKTCGQTFQTPPSQARPYCSKPCADEAKRGVTFRRVEYVGVTCEHCGKRFEARPSVADSKRFCSNDCKYAGLSATAERRRLAATEKRCSACDEVKPVNAFYLRNAGLEGARYSECKACYGLRTSKYYQRTRPARYAAQRRWIARNRAKHVRYQWGYRQENRDALRKKDREFYQRHRERWKAYYHRRRSRERGVPGHFTPRDVARLWHRQRGECARCGARFGKRLEDGGFHIDHIAPLSRPELNPTNWPRNLQLLCETCNCSKKSRTPAEFTLYLRRVAGA